MPNNHNQPLPTTSPINDRVPPHDLAAEQVGMISKEVEQLNENP